MDILVIQGSHNDCHRRVGWAEVMDTNLSDGGEVLWVGNRWFYKDEHKCKFS